MGMVQEDDESDTPEEICFLGTVSSQGDNPWMTTILLNNKPVQFQIDSGAEVPVISNSVPTTTWDKSATSTKDFQRANLECPSCKRTVHGKNSCCGFVKCIRRCMLLTSFSSCCSDSQQLKHCGYSLLPALF